ncbi:hypothetical protein TNCV_3694401 [Trichonephila clavipes]|nr:hypothetical protein TNCV_3694401 [Trichonephila clavipes]
MISIPPSSVWNCHWPCVATWWMVEGRSFGCRNQWGGRGQTWRTESTNEMDDGSEHGFRIRPTGIGTPSSSSTIIIIQNKTNRF